jgi:hypothetical protein
VRQVERALEDGKKRRLRCMSDILALRARVALMGAAAKRSSSQRITLESMAPAARCAKFERHASFARHPH